MIIMAAYIIMAIIAYLIGSVNSSVIISKKMAGFDVREKGSGNAGTTNMLRTVGKKAAALTFVLDILKGIIAVLIAILIGNITKDTDKSLLVQIAALLVIVGHTFPIFFQFKGGKGIATSLGVLLIVNWKIGLICLLFWLVLVILTRMVSVGSLGAAILFPVLTPFIREEFIVKDGSGYLIFSILLATLVIYNHRKNIQRIFEGKENRLSFKK